MPCRTCPVTNTPIDMSMPSETGSPVLGDSDTSWSDTGKALPLKAQLERLFEENIVAKILRTSREALVDNVSITTPSGE